MKLKRLLPSLLALSLAVSASAAPLGLDEAVALALKKNQAIRVQDFGRQAAKGNVTAALGKFDPSLTFRRTYSEDGTPASSNPLVQQLTKTDDYKLGLEGTTPWGLSYNVGASAQNYRTPLSQGSGRFSDEYSTFGGITVTQPLLKGFGFGENLYNLRLAKADRSIADWDFRQSAIDTVTQVVLAYNDLVEALENRRLAHAYRDAVAKILDDNQKRFQVGSLADADVTQAKARVADLEESVIFADRSVVDVSNRLRRLIGETRFEINEPLEVAALARPEHYEANPSRDLGKAFELRPDYQAAKLGIYKQQASLSQARNQRLPQVDFVGSVGYAGLDQDFAASRQQVRSRDNRSVSAGVVVSVPLTLSEGRGRARAAKAYLRQSEERLAALEADIALSLASTAAQIETARKRVDVLAVAHKLAQESLDAEIKRLRAGTGNTFVVLQKQSELANVESRENQALADERRALANYQRELGTTLAERQITIE